MRIAVSCRHFPHLPVLSLETFLFSDLICKEGLDRGHLKPVVSSNVAMQIQEWRDQSILIYGLTPISSTILAELFVAAKHDNLNLLISGFFEHKQGQSNNFENILIHLRLPRVAGTGQALYFAADHTECLAARQAGFSTVVCSTVRSHCHDDENVISCLDQIVFQNN